MQITTLNENNLVSKSRKLIYAEWSHFSAAELKLFETYLSRINPQDPESSRVKFTRNEYAELMGLKDGRNLKSSTLKKRLNAFIDKKIGLVYGENDYALINLFSGVFVKTDKESGEVTVELACNDMVKELFFNLAESGYIKYRLKYTVGLKSEYSIKLYSMLKDHAWGNYEWLIDLKELRKLLGADDRLYEKFPEFNRRILKRATDEINATTDIQVDYERIIKGRLTRGVKFRISNKGKLTDTEVLEGQLTIDELLAEKTATEPKQAPQNRHDLYAELFELINPAWSITPEQIEHIVQMLNDTTPYEPLQTVEERKLGIYDRLHSILLHAKAEGAKSIYNWLEFMATNTDLLERY